MALSMITKCRLLALFCIACLAAVFQCFLQSPGWILGGGTVVLSLLAMLFLHISYLEPSDSFSWGAMLVQYMAYSYVFIFRKRCLSRIQDHSSKLHENQKALLKEILQKNAGCNFGSKFGFSMIKSREEYKTKIPLQTYKDIEPYMENLANGIQNQLTKDDVYYFATSSGTTGKNKLLPITKDFKTFLYTRFVPMGSNACKQWRLGKTLILFYKGGLKKTPGGIMAGALSMTMISIAPFFTSPKPVFDISNEPVVLYLHALYGLIERDIWRIDGVFSTLFLSFWQLIEENWQNLCDDIEHGTIKESLELDDDIRRQLSGTLEPNPKRARELRHEFSRGFIGVAGRVWKNVDHINVITSGSFALHTNILYETYCNGWQFFSSWYGASESFMGVNLDPSNDPPRYTFIQDHVFYEFIPEENIGEDQPETYFIDQIEVNKRYEIALTSVMGLYRYRLGDVIEIVDFLNQVPVFEFKYRSGQMLNLYWEKMPETVFYSALQDTISQLEDIDLVDYTTTESINLPEGTDSLVPKSTKCYILFVEIARKGEESTWLQDSSKTLFDDTLRGHFELYNTLRANSSIGPMKVIQVKGETFKEFKLSRVKNTPSVQFKMPRVVRDKTSVKFMLGKQMNKG